MCLKRRNLYGIFFFVCSTQITAYFAETEFDRVFLTLFSVFALSFV